MRNNEEGMTLIELLTALVILSMVTTILYSFLLMGVSMYKRVTIETQMRNQGDAVYSQIISELKDAVYVQQLDSGDNTTIRYAKRSADAKAYIDLYQMQLEPNAANGKIEVTKDGAPVRSFALGSKFTIDSGSLKAISQNLVQVQLTYTRSNASNFKSAENPKMEIDSQIPLFRND